MLLAVTRLPSSSDSFQKAAVITGLSAADVQRRCAGTLPRVLLLDADEGRLANLRSQLQTLGFSVLLVDPAQVPGDDQRIVARSLELDASGLVVIEGTGSESRHVVPASSIELLQRGLRAASQVKTTTTTERKFAAGRAILTGGLALTKKVQTTTTTREENREPFVVVHRNDGNPDVVLYEHRLDYRFLGKQMQPTSRGNLEATVAKVRALAPGAPLETRVQQPGFVQGLPAFGAVEPVDLALYLVRMARAGGN